MPIVSSPLPYLLLTHDKADYDPRYKAKYPSSTAFDAIQDSLGSSDQARADAIKQANAVFAIKLRNSANEVSTWYIDLKDKGEVKRGEPEKATGAFIYCFDIPSFPLFASRIYSRKA